MDSPPAAPVDTTAQLSYREEAKNDLDSLNYLQAEMTKTTKELERLRLGLFTSSEKVQDEDREECKDNLEESFAIPGLSKERTKSALERINARQKDFKLTELSVGNHHKTNLAAVLDVKNVGHVSNAENLPKIGVKETDSIDSLKDHVGRMKCVTEKVEVQDWKTVKQSLSIPRLGGQMVEMQMLNSSKSLPSLVDGNTDLNSSQASSWDQETATGRVLMQSLANENKLEERLLLSKDEIRCLTNQLHQVKSHYEREAEKKKETIHALLQRVDEISERKQEELNLREQDIQSKEEIIKQLQKTLQDAETAMKVMEKVLDETKGNLRLERKWTSSKDEALIQIYEAVKPRSAGGRNESVNLEDGDEERRKDIVTKTPLVVAERVKGYIDGRENQLLVLIKQLEEAEQKLKDHQLEMEGTFQKLKSEHKEKLIQLTETHDRQLESVSERAANARKQTLGLQAQIAAVEEHSQLEMKTKERQITELTGTIESLKGKIEESASESQAKLENIQMQLQGTQSLLEDRNAAKLQLETEIASLKRQLIENQETMKGSSNTLDEVLSENVSLSKEKESLLVELAECRKKLEETVREVVQLKEKIREEKEKSEHHLKQEISQLEAETTRKTSEREKECESQIKDCREKIEKVQLELEKKNVELSLQMETNQTFVVKINELQSQFENVSKERTELALILDAKDKDLIVLQHERKLLENLYEKSRKESQEELRKKDKLEGDLNEIEPRYWELLVENQELLDKLEKEGEKVLKINEDNTNVKSELDRIKKELEKVKISRSDVLKKLSIREKRLKHAEEDLMKEGEKLEMKNLEMEKLQQERDLMKTELKKEKLKTINEDDLRLMDPTNGCLQSLNTSADQIEKLAKENNSTLHQVSENEMKNEKEKRILKSQINILQNELRLVKGALHANKSVDGKAVQFAEDMRKNAEKKRSLLESLQSKNYHLEEQLEVANKNIGRLEVENQKLLVSCKKTERKLEKIGKEYNDMAERRKEQRALLAKLEAALEMAALKFSESQGVIEKQEQDIARLKLQHQLELKELKGNLLNQFALTHILPKVQNASPDIPVENITLGKKWTREAVGKDLKERPKVEKIRHDLERKQDFEEHLKRLLEEMYQMLRGRGDLRDGEKQYNKLEEGLHITKTPKQWNNEIDTACDLDNQEEMLPPKGSSESDSRHQGHQENDIEALSDGAAACNQSSISTADSLSPVSTLLNQEAFAKRHNPPEMKSIKATLEKIQSQTEGGKDVESFNRAVERWNNSNEREINTRMIGLQHKLEKLAAVGDELKENNKDMERFLDDT